MVKKPIRTFPQAYIDQVFAFWYSAGCPEFTQRVIQSFPEYDGERPARVTLLKWVDTHNWRIRANELDSKALKIVDESLVTQRVEMLKRQADEARQIQEKALSHLLGDKFDSSAAAVKAFFAGVELERSSLGLTEALRKLGQMTDEEIRKRIREFAERDGAQILDREEVVNEAPE